MKKRLILLLTFLLCLCLLTACGETAQTPSGEDAPASSGQSNVRDAVPQGKIDYLGGWQDAANDKVVLTVVPTQSYGDFAVLVRRSDSAQETTEWSLNVLFNEESGELEYWNGEKFERSYGEDGESVTEKQIWTDSQGTFRLNDAKELEWTDNREDFAASCRFTRTYAKTPSEAQFVESFYRLVAHLEEGTAGASLKRASAACKIVDFADGCELWNANTDELRAVMLSAWQSLTDTERESFSGNFPAVAQLMTAALAATDGRYGVFDDAGVGDRIRELMGSDFARYSWATLYANMLTLGES